MMPRAEADDVADSVSTIIPKAEDVVSFDVSITVCHEKPSSPQYSQYFGLTNNIVTYHAISLVSKIFQLQPIRYECTLRHIVKVVERRPSF